MTSTRGRSTSIYIPADLVDAVESSKMTLTEIMRRGLANTKHVHSCGCGTRWKQSKKSKPEEVSEETSSPGDRDADSI